MIIKPRFDAELPDHLNNYTHDVIGAAIEVHRHLGPGLLEAAYEEALQHELRLREIRFVGQFECVVDYKGKQVGVCRFDLLVEDELVVELKAVEAILPVHKAQVRSYLRTGGFRLRLLINFNVPTLREGVTRVILSR
jgi:GxxExxY protein